MRKSGLGGPRSGQNAGMSWQLSFGPSSCQVELRRSTAADPMADKQLTCQQLEVETACQAASACSIDGVWAATVPAFGGAAV